MKKGRNLELQVRMSPILSVLWPFEAMKVKVTDSCGVRQ